MLHAPTFTRFSLAAILLVGVSFVSSCRSVAHAAVAHAAVAPADAASGWLCIVGGGGTTDDMYARMLAAAGGNDAHVVILPQASELSDTGASSVEAWQQHGATNVESLDLSDPARDAAKLREAKVIWFPGGVQTKLMDALRNAHLVELVRQRHHDGAVVGGTSAGAAVMSDVMITGDYDLGFKLAPKPDAKAEDADDGDSGLKYIRSGTNVFSNGLGLISNAIVDQHFVRRQRFNRLMSAVIDHPTLVGIGIDEKTAIFVHGGRFEVLGKSNVVVIDARGAKEPEKASAKASASAEPGAIEGVVLRVLRAGMTFDFAR